MDLKLNEVLLQPVSVSTMYARDYWTRLALTPGVYSFIEIHIERI